MSFSLMEYTLIGWHESLWSRECTPSIRVYSMRENDISNTLCVIQYAFRENDMSHGHESWEWLSHSHESCHFILINSCHSHNSLEHRALTHFHELMSFSRVMSFHSHKLHSHELMSFSRTHVILMSYVIFWAYDTLGAIVGSIKLHVSFAEYGLFYRALLQKRPRI